jgi:hypothetical protein
LKNSTGCHFLVYLSGKASCHPVLEHSKNKTFWGKAGCTYNFFFSPRWTHWNEFTSKLWKQKKSILGMAIFLEEEIINKLPINTSLPGDHLNSIIHLRSTRYCSILRTHVPVPPLQVWPAESDSEHSFSSVSHPVCYG